jgi:hypothetical protein
LRNTVLSPVELYACDGFWSVELVPSPKDQFHVVGVPVDASVNATLSRSAGAVLDAEKSARRVGGAVARTVMVWDAERLVSIPFDTVRFAV